MPFWDLSGHINDQTSKKIPLTAHQDLIAKLFGQQPVKILLIEGNPGDAHLIPEMVTEANGGGFGLSISRRLVDLQ